MKIKKKIVLSVPAIYIKNHHAMFKNDDLLRLFVINYDHDFTLIIVMNPQLSCELSDSYFELLDTL